MATPQEYLAAMDDYVETQDLDALRRFLETTEPVGTEEQNLWVQASDLFTRASRGESVSPPSGKPISRIRFLASPDGR